jgi:hypothetical protein
LILDFCAQPETPNESTITIRQSPTNPQSKITKSRMKSFPLDR